MCNNPIFHEGRQTISLRSLPAKDLQASKGINLANKSLLIVEIVLSCLSEMIKQLDESGRIISEFAFDTILHDDLIINDILIMRQLSVIVQHNHEQWEQENTPDRNANNN